MSTRLEVTLKKHPEHEEGIRLLAERDPSGNLKYLEWGARMLVAKQALAPEIANVVELFHQFNGRGLPGARRGPRSHVDRDIYTYRPQDMAGLRDKLLALKRAADRKRKKREELYRIEGDMDFEVVYDSSDLIVRHIKNKQASVHYGLGTKWCISMLREGYFEDYETSNATFFFFERKNPKGDEYDKIAVMLPRNDEREETVDAYTTIDRHVDMMTLAKVHGPVVFDIFRQVYECSERYPGSAMTRVYAGTATQEQLEVALENASKIGSYELRSLLEVICCNDATPASLLGQIVHQASNLFLASCKRQRMRNTAYRRNMNLKELERVLMSAVAIHPNTSAELLEEATKWLRRRHIQLGSIFRDTHGSRVSISYGSGGHHRNRRLRHRRRRHEMTVKQLREYAGVLHRRSIKLKKKARTLQRKLAEKKRKLAERKKRASKKKTASKKQ